MSRPHTPFASVPDPSDAHAARGYGSGINDFAQGNPSLGSPLAQQSNFHEDFNPGQRESSSIVDDAAAPGLGRSTSTAST